MSRFLWATLYLHLWYALWNLCSLVDFKFPFALYIKFNLSISTFSKKCTHLFISVFHYESLALNTINCTHFCLYSWHETYKNCVQIIFLYLMLHIFHYSGILYPVVIANTIIAVLQVYWVVPIWSNSYTWVLKTQLTQVTWVQKSSLPTLTGFIKTLKARF